LNIGHTLQVSPNPSIERTAKRPPNRMFRTATLSLAIIGVIWLSGCAAPINELNANRHLQSGAAFARAGDWRAARRQYAQAVVNADLGHVDASLKGRAYYEYGRALGATCSFAEAEKYLQQSAELAQASGAFAYLPLYELGLLFQTEGKNVLAADSFARTEVLVEQAGLGEKFPLGVADIYERHAAVLDLVGESNRATVARTKAQELRLANPGASQRGLVTPYGAHCEPVT
jgi:hypothetical protein